MKTEKYYFGMVYKLVLLVVIIIVFFIMNYLITKNRNKILGEYNGANEFVRTIDCAGIIDANEGKKIKIEFDLRAEKAGPVLVFSQNGAGARYHFSEMVDATTEFQHYAVVVAPVMVNINEKDSYLAFYGTYGTDVYPRVKNIVISVYE